MSNPRSGDGRSPFAVRLLATGGTIEKTYDPARGALTLDVPVIQSLLDGLRQPDIRVGVERVMAKDSLDMSDGDREAIVQAVRMALDRGDSDAVVVTHGTDTLADTAAALVDGLSAPAIPVLLTGAMVPWRVADSDAAQNMAQALMAARLVEPGVYAVFHSRVIPGDRVVKDYDRLTLVEASDAPA
ncbi:asparaginase [Salinisphaera sp. T31B1]|uniref:asparaginase n=1 Tax=Salinisphaera sp. T31B1 TaxID=727963 RepID=UPI003342690D